MAGQRISLTLKSPWVQAAGGVLISIVGLFWAFHDFSFSAFVDALNGVNYYYIAAAGMLMVFSIFIRAIRWDYLISVEKKVSRYSLFKAEFIGYFGNFILPLRLGELLRSFVVSKGENLSGSFVFGSIVLERLFDTIGMGCLTVLLILQYQIPDEIQSYIHFGLLGIILISAGLIILFIRLNKIKSKNKMALFVKDFTESFKLLKGSVRYKAFGLTLILWLIYWASTHLIQMAMHLNMTMANSLIVLVFTSYAASIPAAPGMIGTYHAAAKYTLVSVIGGYTATQAINYAIVLHAYAYLLFIVIGGYYFLQNQFKVDAFRQAIRHGDINEN